MTSWMLTPSPSLAVPVFYTDGLASNLTTLSYPLLAWTLSSLLPPSTHLSHRCPSCLHPAARQLLDLYLPSLIPPPHSLLLRRQQSSTVILKTSRQTHPFIKVALQCSLSCPGDPPFLCAAEDWCLSCGCLPASSGDLKTILHEYLQAKLKKCQHRGLPNTMGDRAGWHGLLKPGQHQALVL